MKLQPQARSIATYVLDRVLYEDAFAAAVLNAALERYPNLDPRERSLATELVYGTLRNVGYLEERLAQGAPRGLDKLDRSVRCELLVAAYQILLLERIPHFAAVSEAVSRIRAVRGPKLAAFGNAVLRRLCEKAGEKTDPLEAAVRATAPWLRESLERALGAEGARALLGTSGAPPIGLRVRRGEDRSAWLERLQRGTQGERFELGKVSPFAILSWSAGDPKRLAGYEEGAITVQEEGAQLVALAVGATQGERILDACAGRGNKTSLLAEIPGVTVDSADLHPSKLERLDKELERLGHRVGRSYAVDWSVGPGEVPVGYDRVLVDAPCSGTGTLRRRPELALRRSRLDDITALTALQSRMTAQAATRLRYGGTLIYAVCSVLREEAEDAVARILAEAPPLALCPFPAGPAAELAGEAPILRLLPYVHGTDGYFLASFRRVG